MDTKKEELSTDSITHIVRESWNEIGKIYATNRNVRKMDRELYKFKSLIPSFGNILDVGSGAGVPVAKFLVENNFHVVGIDISDTMLELAAKNVPQAVFRKMDMLNIEFPENSFDGLVCVYAIFHLPRSTHQTIFVQFFRVLSPNGILLLNTGVFGSEGFSRFFDVPMFWSSHLPEETLVQVKTVGFDIISEGVLNRGGESQYWIFARKPK